MEQAHNRGNSGEVSMKDVKTRWAVYDDGLKIWYNGKLIAEIDPDEFPYLLSDLAVYMKKKFKK